MLYGILFAVVGVLSGGVVALFYRSKQGDQRATIVGLNKDNAALNVSIEHLEASLQDATVKMQKMEQEHAKEIDSITADFDLHIQHASMLRKQLNAALQGQPVAVAERIARLFPVPTAGGNGDQGSSGNSGSTSSGSP